MLQTILTKVFGTKSDRDTKGLIPIVDKINTIYETLQTKSNDDLINRTGELKLEVSSACEVAQKYAKEKISDNEEADKYVLNAEHKKLDEILPETFAMVKEACRRTMGKSWRIMGQEISWEMIPYDVQILGGIVLHSGKVTEMKTGEGKTLVATMPLYLNALSGRGAHLVTVNDYLAQRDAEWMGEIYKRLGLTVGFILNTMDNRERQDAYNCDITYGTNNEFGFDYLRDNMALAPEDQVQGDHAFVIVDEVDSVLIDEARTPLIISGSVDAPVDTTYKELKPMVQNLIKKQNSLVTEMVAEATRYIDQENNDEAGLKLLQANRGMPKHPRLLKIFQEKGTKKLAHDVESEYMRDKKIHEVDAVSYTHLTLPTNREV